MNRNDENKNLILAILAGAAIAIILKQLLEKEHKKDGSDLAVGLLGGALGAGVYALLRQKNEENNNKPQQKIQPNDIFHFASNNETNEANGLIDSVRVSKLWASIPYAKRISKHLAKEYTKPNSQYEIIYSGESSYGKIQDDFAHSSHQFLLDELLQLKDFSNISDYNLKKLKYFSSLNEEKTKDIYENGKYILDFTTFNFGNGELLSVPSLTKFNVGIIGTNQVLSDKVAQDVKNMFYNKNLSQNSVLLYNEKSEISKDLHNNYNFQKEYYTKLVLPFLYKNIENFVELDKMANKIKQYNFSNVSDIITYSFYGLMGGTQVVKFAPTIYKRHDGAYYLVDLFITISDWYGADKDDIITKREYIQWQSNMSELKKNIEKADISCLNAFFWLQHHFGCSPFKTEIVFHDYLLFAKPNYY